MIPHDYQLSAALVLGLCLGIVGGWQWRGVIQRQKLVITIHAHDCIDPIIAKVSEPTTGDPDSSRDTLDAVLTHSTED